MKFFTKEVVEEEGSRELWDEACRLRYIEYLKTRKRLPKRFIDVYEKTSAFDDAHMVDISFVTERANFTYGQKRCPPSKIRMILVDYEDQSLVWEILISSINEASVEWVVINDSNAAIDSINYDEWFIEDDTCLSWEINFVGGFNIKIIFKNISIRKLSEQEIDRYRQPAKARRITKQSQNRT
jgi:hypothetical protein